MASRTLAGEENFTTATIFPSSKRGFLNVGVENIAQKGIFTRGVLIDLPRMYEVDSIDPGTLITLEHIEAS